MERNHKIGIVMATLLEADPFIYGFSLNKIDDDPFKIYSNDNIFLIISGIGKCNAAMATFYFIWKYKFDCLFNIGAAGATKRDKKIGDIFQISKVIEYDRPRISNGGPRFVEPNIIQGFFISTLSTQDRPIIDNLERERISSYADLVDMEGASFIQACKLLKSKCYLFKFVSDTPDLKNEYDIVENIKQLRESMFDFFYNNVLDRVTD